MGTENTNDARRGPMIHDRPPSRALFRRPIKGTTKLNRPTLQSRGTTDSARATASRGTTTTVPFKRMGEDQGSRIGAPPPRATPDLSSLQSRGTTDSARATTSRGTTTTPFKRMGEDRSRLGSMSAHVTGRTPRRGTQLGTSAGISSQTFQPLTSIEFKREICLSFCKACTFDQIERMAGNIFEHLVAESIGENPNSRSFPSDARKYWTRNWLTNVVPDFVFDHHGIDNWWRSLTFESHHTYLDSIMADAKASKSVIGRSYRDYQIVGMIDWLGHRSPASSVMSTLPPVLILFTTSDTKVAPSLIREASQNQVLLMQSKMDVRAGDNGHLQFRTGPLTELNGDVPGIWRTGSLRLPWFAPKIVDLPLPGEKGAPTNPSAFSTKWTP
jgi:hypothetical protein